ncbi:MAG: substrate-binding domain-containing protein [Oscillospiraceae bacterium]|nr:substrate-binding domain-containing protein [Oscillospiraceae bacterium]
MKRKILATLTLVLALALIVGCTQGNAPEVTTTTAATTQAQEAPTTEASVQEDNQTSAAGDYSDQLYIHVSALSNLDYFYDHIMGTEMVGKELGVKTEYVGPADYDMNAMIAAFEQAIAKKPNGIVTVGFEDSLTPVIKKALDAGIPVITLDADLPDSGRIAFVGTGNYNAGVMGGNKLAEAINGSGKVALMTKPGQSNLEERVAGYQAALAKFPGIEIVQIADTQSDDVVAAQAAATLLQAHPDLAGIGCVEAVGGAGAATAVREAGRQGEVAIISMDRSNDVVNAIINGEITASVAQQTALMPYYGIQILFNLNNSDVAITSNNEAAGVAGIPNMIDTGAIIVDKSNAQYFLR